MYPFKCALVPGVPNNEGLFAPVRVVAPEGCILNTTFPHPVNARAKTTNNINQVLFGALWPVLGEHAQAGSGSIWPFSVSGTSAEHGRFSVHVLPHGGRGAMRDLDGMVPIAFPHNSAVTPVEVFETQCPVRIGRKALRPTPAARPASRRARPGDDVPPRRRAPDARPGPPRQDRHPAPGLDGGAAGRRGRVLFNGVELHEFPILAFRPGDEITPGDPRRSRLRRTGASASRARCRRRPRLTLGAARPRPANPRRSA
jgi:N-methylhydantoinase B